MKRKYCFVPVEKVAANDRIYKPMWKRRTEWACSIEELFDKFKPCPIMIAVGSSFAPSDIADIRRQVFSFEGQLYGGKSSVDTPNTPDEIQYFCLVHRDFIQCSICGKEHGPGLCSKEVI